MTKFMNSQMTSQNVNDMTENEKQQYCDHLKSIRANFAECCVYPSLTAWGWQIDECDVSCRIGCQIGSDNYCCSLYCYYYKMQLMTLEREITTGLLLPGKLNEHGFINSFMLSVGNDTQWEPIIKDVVGRCYSQFAGSSSDYYCEIIPYTLWNVAQCCYVELFMKCPNWNPKGLSSCAKTYEYAVKCITSGSEIQYDY